MSGGWGSPGVQEGEEWGFEAGEVGVRGFRRARSGGSRLGERGPGVQEAGAGWLAAGEPRRPEDWEAGGVGPEVRRLGESSPGVRRPGKGGESGG